MRRWTFIAALLLSACATPPAPPAQGWSGKLGYRVEASSNQRAQAGSALFELQGDAREGRMLLTSPLGTSLAEASWNQLGAWLRHGETEQSYESIEALGQALGEALQGPPLPLQALVDWLQGRPWPQAAHLPAEGGFEQLGWRVEHRPPQLLLSRPAQGGSGAMSLRLILSP